MVPTDLQVRLERFRALWLPLRACTVSTGLEGCQRECTRARRLAESRTLESCRRFVPEQTLEHRFTVSLWRLSRRGRRLRDRRDLGVVRAGRGWLLEPARRG